MEPAPVTWSSAGTESVQNHKIIVKYSCSVPQVFKRNVTQQKQNGTTCTKKTRYRSAAHFGNKITREWSREAPAATAQAQQQQQRAGKHCRAQQSTAAAQHSTAQHSSADQSSAANHSTGAHSSKQAEQRNSKQHRNSKKAKVGD